MRQEHRRSAGSSRRGESGLLCRTLAFSERECTRELLQQRAISLAGFAGISPAQLEGTLAFSCGRRTVYDGISMTWPAGLQDFLQFPSPGVARAFPVDAMA